MKKLLLLTTAAFSMILSSYAVSIDVSDSGAWNGYMNVFDNNGGSQGGYLWGSAWGTADLDTSYAGGVLTMAPNTNLYADSPGDAYWQNGDDGAKFLEANMYVEVAGADQTFTFAGNVDSISVDSRYGVSAFIKGLGSAGDTIETVSISSTGAFSLTSTVAAGNVAQLGFMMTGINANPATDWGNVQFSGLSASAVPEPSTYALIAGFAAFLFVAIRRRK